ncbi:putative histidine decarboxylase [Arcobacter nitrofigilis DSM 7299]|uniref:Putative histidine decarboxylase n=1 Tax=Arcobacter nitrofigilis (strain ATCC 33309 / DSM 7299 / CCUG 15893 / LMG 7604 / NCTC 12251 / CI) TaxID=572480 RepID=D5V3Z3_ARCNC|nr:pyridoxal-dependent decarboxylase [Arcobacter nitrofigilis]ADG92821.1 putative histidine decarboxylase [Arcobacter nitrofigilis DSM 7299]
MNINLNKTNEELSSKYFKINNEKMTLKKKEKALKKLSDYETIQKKTFLGYQMNEKFNFEKNYSKYLNIGMNNVGDPFVGGDLTLNTKSVETEVLNYFAKLWNNKERTKPLGKDDYWGYIVSMGCTEANIFGLLSARDYLEGKFLLIDEERNKKAKKISKSVKDLECIVNKNLISKYATAKNKNELIPIAFYSQDAHYSIVKAMEVLKINTLNKEANEKGYKCPLKKEDYPKNFSREYLDENGWPKEVPSNEDGSIHVPALVKLVKFFAKKGHPILISFNYGSTFKGAYDDIKGAVDQIVPILKKYGLYEREIEYEIGKKDIRNGFWFHVDGALGAAYMPYLEKALKQKLIKKPSKNYKFPIFDFRIKEIHSISMSGHKYIGSPWPSGIYMSKIKYQLKPVDDPMYIGAPDTTFAGSRNAFSPLIFWEYLSNNSMKSHIKEVVKCEEMAQYAFKKLKALDKKDKLWIQRSPLSLTIRMKIPNKKLVFKYSLSTEELYVNGEPREYAHIYIMHHVDKNLIDSFIEDLKKSNYFNE